MLHVTILTIMRVTILGITGYTGKELLTLLLSHPRIDEVVPVSVSQPDIPVSDIHPSIQAQHPKLAFTNYKTVTADLAKAMPTDTVFSCLPHRHSHKICLGFLDSARIIDLSADFRLEPSTYETTYNTPFPSLPPKSKRAYGLCELFRESIQAADIIAVPGCFAGTILSVLLPLHNHDMLPNLVTCVALTGISGAGRQKTERFSFCERNENICAYAPLREHRHVVEIEEKLDNAIQLQVTPVLSPLQRGIYAIITMQSKNGKQLIDVIENQYQNEPFVRVKKNAIPEISDVLHTNMYHIGAVYNQDTVQWYACCDNLLKGASGQALQCFNRMHGFNETTGF